MNFNEEIEQLVKNREEKLEKEFEIIVKRCLEVIKKEKCFIRTFIFYYDQSIVVISNFARDFSDYLISGRVIPIIDEKYFYYLDDEVKCFDEFLKDFEYYLYKNTNFEFHEVNTAFGKTLCVELPM